MSNAVDASSSMTPALYMPYIIVRHSGLTAARFMVPVDLCSRRNIVPSWSAGGSSAARSRSGRNAVLATRAPPVKQQARVPNRPSAPLFRPQTLRRAAVARLEARLAFRTAKPPDALFLAHCGGGPAQRSRGVFTVLLAPMIAARRPNLIELDVSSSNPRAVALNRRLGFHPVGTRCWGVGRSVAAFARMRFVMHREATTRAGH